MIVRDLIDLLFTYPSKAEVRIYDGEYGSADEFLGAVPELIDPEYHGMCDNFQKELRKGGQPIVMLIGDPHWYREHADAHEKARMEMAQKMLDDARHQESE